MSTQALQTLVADLERSVRVDDDGRVSVLDENKLRVVPVDTLAKKAIFGEPQQLAAARWVLWELGQALGIYPASINGLYMARGRGAEYLSVVMAAAIKEGYRGPLFVQGDHFQVNAKKFKSEGGRYVRIGRLTALLRCGLIMATGWGSCLIKKCIFILATAVYRKKPIGIVNKKWQVAMAKPCKFFQNPLSRFRATWEHDKMSLASQGRLIFMSEICILF